MPSGGSFSAARIAPYFSSMRRSNAACICAEVDANRRAHRLVGFEPLSVGAQQLVQPLVTVGVDDVLDQQRCLEVGEADLGADPGTRR